MTMQLMATMKYMRVENLLGASFWTWCTQEQIEQYQLDRYEVFYAVFNTEEAKTAARATTDDHISDMCYSLAYAQYGYNDESSEYTRAQADAAVFAMRDTLEVVLESLGQEILKPPSEATQRILNNFNRKQVMRMQAAAIMLEEQANQKETS